MKRCPWMLQIPFVLLWTGCATLMPTDTPAQNLARQRIRECDRFPSVQVREVLPDGSIRVAGQGANSVTELPAWKACIGEALEKQKKDGRMAADGQSVILESSELKR